MKCIDLINNLCKFPENQEVYVSIPMTYENRYVEVKEVIGVSHDDPENGVIFIDVL